MEDESEPDIATAANVICDIVRTTVGPFGTNKLLIREDGTVTTTSSGSAVLDGLDIVHPAVTLLRSAAMDFREQHGDGGSTVVAIVGALLDEADRLADRGVHPTVIERGYRDALAVSIEHAERYSRPVSTVGLAAVARTALTGTRNPATRESLAEYLSEVTDAIRSEDSSREFDPGRVKVISRIGAESQTELVRGVVLDKEPVVESMPRTVENAGVAVLSSTVDLPKLGSETSRREVDITLEAESFENRDAFAEREREAFREQLRTAVDAGCRLIVTSRAVNDRVEATLAKNGILALHRVDEDDVSRIARSTGATVVPDLAHVTEETLGQADGIVRRMAGRDMTVIESETGEPVFTLFCRAPDPRSADAFERSVESALAATLLAERTGTVVPGGGAIETNAARAVRDRARSVSGREQVAIEAFADALAVVPRALATNAGMDGWSSAIRLRVAHDEGRDAVGVDAIAGENTDVLTGEPIVEPTALKRAVWSAATDIAVKILRIDARIPASDLGGDEAEYEAGDDRASGTG